MVLITLTALQAVWYAFRIGGDVGVQAFGDIAPIPVTVIGAWLCVRAARGRAPVERRAWLFIGAASASWGIGEAIWTVYEVFLGREVPFPSFADVGFLAMIPLAAVGVLMLGGSSSRAVTRVRAIVDGAIIAGSVLFISWATVLGPTVRASSGPVLQQAIGIAYPIGDLIIIALVLFTAQASRRSRGPLGFVGIGLLLLALADSGFAILTAKGTYGTGSMIDLGWTAGFAVIGLAALCGERSAPRVVSMAAERLRACIPLGALGCALVAAATTYATGNMGPFLWYEGLSLVAMQIANQTLTSLDNLSLRRGLEAKVAARTAELHAAMRKMGEARRLQDQFVAQMSHELRTPLTTMIGASATLVRPELGLSAPVQGLAESVSRNARRMSDLVENLLIVSAMSDRLESMRTPFPLSGELRAACGEHAPARKHLYEHIPDGLRAVGDPERMKVILRELLQNAGKFAPDFTGVWVRAFPRGHMIEIVVSDEGPGVPPGLEDRVFERFFQADSSSTREREGAGLGLYIARKLAESMGGTLKVDLQTGSGATFRLAIPAWIGAESIVEPTPELTTSGAH